MMLGEIRSVLNESGINDILVAGFVDRAALPLRFYALYGAVFFDCGGTLLRLGVLGDTGRMQITRAESVSCGELDDDLEPAWTSIRQVVLSDPDGSNRVRMMHLWDIEEGPVVKCAAARFDLSNGQELFVDPTYHFGIRVGGIQQQTVWLANLPKKDHWCSTLDLFQADG